MPAVKKELPSREDLALALATFHPTLAALPLPPLPGYLAPLPAAAALPPAASLPAATAGYEALLAPPLRAPRAYLSLHEAAPHLHLPRDPLALERFSATAAAAPDFQPLLDNGEPCIEVECGANRALLYVRKLCQGSKGPSIRHRGEWLTPNEFQFVSGRETAKDWKRSIRHKGKSLKTLMSKGILQVHPPICDCPGCRISSPVNRGRLADKRTVALPPARVLKKELTPSFSASGDSDRSGPACGQRLGLKQEDDPHVRIMKRRVHTHWDVNISFRETSCSQDSDLPTLISSVRRSRHLVMPEHQSRCEFQRGSVEVGLGAAGDLLGKRLGRSPHITSDCPPEKKARSKSPPEGLLLPELGPGMAPEDHYRRLVSALSEAGTFEDPQRLYHLGLPGHDLLRVRQEPSGLEVHLPSSTAGQRRKQGLAQHRDGTAPAGAPSFSERELSQPPPLLSPQNAPHIALGPHLRPPFLGVPSALCQTPGYGFLPPAQAEMLARQQELLRKQNLARLEMSAELLRQKELESAHRPQLLAPEAALRPPDGAEELQRRGAMLVLRHSSAPLLALPPQGPPGPGPPTPPREPARRAPRKGGPSPASARPSEPKETTGAGLWAQDGSEDEPPKDSDGEDPEMVAAGGQGPIPGQAPTGGTSSEGKGLASGSMLPPPLPLGLPYTVSPYFHTGATGGLFMDGEGATAPEDVSKWTVDDVCSFVGGLAGCGEYAPVFREQGIDGETLPLLTEEHLLTTMGLKLGPALKIRAQVSACWGQWSPDNGGAALRLFVWPQGSSPAGPIQARLSTGGQAPGPGFLRGQLPHGSAAAAANTAGSREGAQLSGAAPVPSTGPLPLWGRAAACQPGLTRAGERNHGSAPRARGPLPVSVLSWCQTPHPSLPAAPRPRLPTPQLILLSVLDAKTQFLKRKHMI
ncbi:sterile alpha motif domain-containing protein 11 isoform X1 [Mesoplodon densirostris]|uniref:sterile alpha motif domain-containing protein 11 isoform X1 n=1 Tax=Mesoplodon densirostris TaxID=48708 RepID=UPI0028DAFEF7|nr:sterile alpha motif domain-containing protein 11 isoform X1 [Mesoplodon densirostris]